MTNFSGNPVYGIVVAVGTTIADRPHPDDREKLTIARSQLTRENSGLQMTYRMIRPDGRVMWVERNSQAYFEHDKLLRIVGMVADISEHKLAEEGLAGINRRLIEEQEAERARIARDLDDDYRPVPHVVRHCSGAQPDFKCEVVIS